MKRFKFLLTLTFFILFIPFFLYSSEISGIVQLQGREDHSGVEITLLKGNLLVTTKFSDPNGYYKFPDLSSDTYKLIFSYPRQLLKVIPDINLSEGEVKEIPTFKLWGGDANADETINDSDYAILESSMQTMSGEIGYNPSADFNDDGRINMQDFSILASNQGKSSDKGQIVINYLQPSNNSYIKDEYLTINLLAKIVRNTPLLDLNTHSIYIDDNKITSQAVPFTLKEVTYIYASGYISSGISLGEHTLKFYIKDIENREFTHIWQFYRVQELPPDITYVCPTSGATGTEIHLKGNNFYLTQATDTKLIFYYYDFNNSQLVEKEAEITLLTSTELKAIVPSNLPPLKRISIKLTVGGVRDNNNLDFYVTTIPIVKEDLTYVTPGNSLLIGIDNSSGETVLNIAPYYEKKRLASSKGILIPSKNIIMLTSGRQIAVVDIICGRIISLISGFGMTMDIKITPDERYAFVTQDLTAQGMEDSLYPSIAVIDIEKAINDPQNAVISGTSIGADPYKFLITPDGKYGISKNLIVFDIEKSLNDPENAFISDLLPEESEKIHDGSIHDIAITPDSEFLFASYHEYREDNIILLQKPWTKILKEIPINEPENLLTSPDGKYLYCLGEDNNGYNILSIFLILDLINSESPISPIYTINIPASSVEDIELNSDGSILYISPYRNDVNGTLSSIALIDTAQTIASSSTVIVKELFPAGLSVILYPTKICPQITSITPSSSGVEDLITIEGTGFNPTPEFNRITFSGTKGSQSAIESTDTYIIAKVPYDAQSGNINVVSNYCQSASLSFEVLPPQIATADPQEGISGTVVKIYGEHFAGEDIQKNKVTFAGTQAEVASATKNIITVTVPLAAASGPIKVEIDGKISNEIPFSIYQPYVKIINPADQTVIEAQSDTDNNSQNGVQINVEANTSLTTGTLSLMILPESDYSTSTTIFDIYKEIYIDILSQLFSSTTKTALTKRAYFSSQPIPSTGLISLEKISLFEGKNIIIAIASDDELNIGSDKIEVTLNLPEKFYPSEELLAFSCWGNCLNISDNKNGIFIKNLQTNDVIELTNIATPVYSINDLMKYPNLSTQPIDFLHLYPSFSSDGKKIIFQRFGYLVASAPIYIIDIETGASHPFAFKDSPDEPIRGDYPTWSPDGTKIAYVAKNATDTLMIAPVDSDGYVIGEPIPIFENSQRPKWLQNGLYITDLYRYAKFSKSSPLKLLGTTGKSPSGLPIIFLPYDFIPLSSKIITYFPIVSHGNFFTFDITSEEKISFEEIIAKNSFYKTFPDLIVRSITTAAGGKKFLYTIPADYYSLSGKPFIVDILSQTQSSIGLNNIITPTLYKPFYIPPNVIPPIISLNYPEPDSEIEDFTPDIDITLKDDLPFGVGDVSSYTVLINNIDITSSATYDFLHGRLKYTPPTPLPVGENEIFVYAEDYHGNTATATFKFRLLDKIPPTITLIYPPNDSKLTTPPEYFYAVATDGDTGSGIPDDIDHFYIGIVIPDEWGNILFHERLEPGYEVISTASNTIKVSHYAADFLDGDFTLVAYAEDREGNNTYKTWEITIDRTPPYMKIDSPPPYSIVNSSPTVLIRVNIKEAHTGIKFDSLIFKVNNNIVTPRWCYQRDKYDCDVTYDLPYNKLLTYPQNYSVFVSIKDELDNYASVTWNFTYNPSAPQPFYPGITGLTISPRSFNPSAGESVTISYNLAENYDVTAKIRKIGPLLEEGDIVYSTSASQTTGTNSIQWNGIVEGKPVDDSTYRVEITAVKTSDGSTYYSENIMAEKPIIKTFDLLGTIAPQNNKKVEIAYSLDKPSQVLLRVGIPGGPLIRDLLYWEPHASGTFSEFWDGRDSIGTLLPDGNTYRCVMWPLSIPDNAFIAYGNEPGITNLPSEGLTINPLVSTNTISISYTLSESSYVIIRVYDESNYDESNITHVNTLSNNLPPDALPEPDPYSSPTNTLLPAGSYSISWDGKNSSGNQLPPGLYSISIDALDSQNNWADTQYSNVYIIEQILQIVENNLIIIANPEDNITSIKQDDYELLPAPIESNVIKYHFSDISGEHTFIVKFENKVTGVIIEKTVTHTF